MVGFLVGLIVGKEVVGFNDGLDVVGVLDGCCVGLDVSN